MFSMIGMEIFGDAIQTQYQTSGEIYNCLNKNLRDTDFVKFKYCKNNVRFILFEEKITDNTIGYKFYFY